MNILITGANGYLARNLIERFSNYTVYGLTRENNNEQYILDCNPDVVIHTICSYGRKGETVSQIYDSNFLTGMQLLETVSKLDKKITFINCGSSLDKYTNLYSISKTQFVELGKFLSGDKLQFINMNLEHFYGPEAPNNFISFLIYECNRNHAIPLTAGTQKRDFIYIDDVCDAFLTVIKNRNKLCDFDSIDVGTGISIPVKKIVEKVKVLCNSTSMLKFGEVPLREKEKSEMTANISDLVELGWKPKINIDQGLDLMKNFYNGTKKDSKLRQAIILKIALEEAGINPNLCKIKIDHNNGISYVNDVELPIIFPKEYFNLAKRLHATKKEYNFYFNGYVGNDRSRKKLLEPFLVREDSKVIWSNEGRSVSKKFNFNNDYFSELSKSVYGLCPHQLNWKGNKDTLWTYRYIECLMSYVIPVNFKKTPLGKSFVGDSHFVWDDEILEIKYNITKEMLQHNFDFAFNKFTLNRTQIKNIKRRSRTI